MSTAYLYILEAHKSEILLSFHSDVHTDKNRYLAKFEKSAFHTTAIRFLSDFPVLALSIVCGYLLNCR
jgi:hypothetical protein